MSRKGNRWERPLSEQGVPGRSDINPDVSKGRKAEMVPGTGGRPSEGAPLLTLRPEPAFHAFHEDAKWLHDERKKHCERFHAPNERESQARLAGLGCGYVVEVCAFCGRERKCNRRPFGGADRCWFHGGPEIRSNRRCLACGKTLAEVSPLQNGKLQRRSVCPGRETHQWRPERSKVVRADALLGEAVALLEQYWPHENDGRLTAFFARIGGLGLGPMSEAHGKH